MTTAYIDHVLVGVPDLEAGIGAMEGLMGVRPVLGGEHPHWGTHNALLSLGDGIYFELIAVRPGAEAPKFEHLRSLSAPTPIGWAVRVDDPREVSSLLRGAGLAPTDTKPGSRQTPAGAVLRWETFDLDPAPAGSPFFIHWLPETAHPSKTSPSGCSLSRFEIASPDAAELVRLRDALGLRLDIREAETPRMTLTLRCPKGTVTLPAT
ncbi:MAG TPA: VOC family protein [Thermoanaerobaculia bacterium]|nr:VOC family protein [Thermoanaerobaculia bacterium]